jgi:hypothetical protein
MGRSENWLLLGDRLKETVKKLKLRRRRRRLRFDAPTGWHCYMEDEKFNGNCLVAEIQRPSSYDSDDDIDRKADIFIANFYHQLRLERG